MLIDKYTPASLQEVIGNSDCLAEVRMWAQAWQQGKNQKPLLLAGAPGVGKTATAYACAKEFGWTLVEFNASDVRDKESMEKSIAGAAYNSGFDGKRRLVLIDEIDAIHGREDKGGLSALLEIMRHAQNPLILTANDIYADKKLASVRSFAKIVQYKKVPFPSIGKWLSEIADKEGIDYDARSIQLLAKNSSGDCRAALIDLETLSNKGKKLTMEDVERSGYRERVDNIFSVIRTLYTGTSLSEIRRARFTLDMDHDLMKKWIEENIPRQFPQLESQAIAFNQLSRGDIFDGRIFRRQHYGFLRYSGDLVSTVGLAVPERAHGFIPYQFPVILKQLAMKRDSQKKVIVEKIAEKSHSSKSRWGKEMGYWEMLVENPAFAESVAAYYELDEDDMAYLFDTSADSVKIKKFMLKVAELKERLAPRAHNRNHISPQPASEDVTSSIPLVTETQSDSKTKAKRTKAGAKEAVAPADEKEEKAPKKQTSLSSFFGG
ncbi:MAG: replication factor C large subunit [Candidatus Iainarchaeum archaeon]|uniref:Replication factor C large subunit n=1 Tax=Candidatus Iainarchaeum sp. TaxID=3101447 RepID=A0A7T9DJR1_9ARCH|nr:MAG: replication factor C large subunit [Candidatus Diapherotrites archaeon]